MVLLGLLGLFGSDDMIRWPFSLLVFRITALNAMSYQQFPLGGSGAEERGFSGRLFVKILGVCATKQDENRAFLTGSSW